MIPKPGAFVKRNTVTEYSLKRGQKHRRGAGFCLLYVPQSKIFVLGYYRYKEGACAPLPRGKARGAIFLTSRITEGIIEDERVLQRVTDTP